MIVLFKSVATRSPGAEHMHAPSVRGCLTWYAAFESQPGGLSCLSLTLFDECLFDLSRFRTVCCVQVGCNCAPSKTSSQNSDSTQMLHFLLKHITRALDRREQLLGFQESRRAAGCAQVLAQLALPVGHKWHAAKRVTMSCQQQHDRVNSGQQTSRTVASWAKSFSL